MGRVLLIAVVLVAIALVVNAVVMDSETRPAKADVGKIVNLEGPDLQVLDQGPRDAPAVVLVHCYTCSMKWWQPVADGLATDHRVVSVDLIGHGGSEKPTGGYSIGDQARQVWRALDAVGVDHAFLAGHSLGGLVVTEMTESDPDRVDGLIVTGTQGVPDNRQLPLQAQLGYIPVIGEGLMRIVPDSMLESGLASAFAPGYRLPDFALTDLRKLNYSAFDKSPTAFDVDIAEKSVPERLQGLDVPVLYIQGRKDQLVDPPTAEESWGSIDGAQVEEISGAGHSPILEATGETTKLMRNFMGAAGKPG